MLRILVVFTVVMALQVPPPASAPQPPPFKPQNLQHFPKDISRGDLVQRMREFSFALGVRCQYCHVDDPKQPMNFALFALDDKPAKVKARAMLKMVDQLNGSMLPVLPARAEPKVVVECATCHRGLPLPKTLQTTLLEIPRTTSPSSPNAPMAPRPLRRLLASGRISCSSTSRCRSATASMCCAS